MNRKMIAYVLGFIIKVEGLLMIPSFIIAMFYREKSAIAFLITITGLILIGSSLSFKKPDNKVIYAKEGFVIVAGAWILLSIFGAFPFFISREIPKYIDSFFETVSGITTTGSSILTDVEALSKGILFWRSFLHWIGGMGVLVFVLAIVPLAGGRSVHLMKAEVTGPTYGKLVPKLKQTAMILYGIYTGLTIIVVVLLLLGGMNWLDSFLHAFGTVGTGGFGIKNNSVAYYNSAYIEGVITVFMLLCSLNFNLFYLILCKDIIKVLKSEELRWFAGIVAFSILIISMNILPLYGGIEKAFRYASFQVASIISTSGFSSIDYNSWPELSKSILFILTFLGGCAGSTAGGLKVARLIIIFKNIMFQIKSMIHPRYINVIRFEDTMIDEKRIREVNNYFVIYIFIGVVSFLILSLDGFDFETTVTAMATTLNNVGPGFGKVGPAGNFSEFSTLSKAVMSLNMLIGRLEIYPIILLFTPALYRRRKSGTKKIA